MKRILYINIICLVLSMIVRVSLFAAFKDNGWGARPAGMGGAFTAVADDANGPLYNPAGMMQLKCPEGNFMYSKLYAGLDNVDMGLNYLAYIHPTVSWGAFGVTWADFAAKSLYREDTFTLSYAHSLNDFMPDLTNEYLLGVNLKYLRNSFTLDQRTRIDPVFSGGASANAWTADVGGMVNFYEESIGFSVKNINEPDIGLRTREIIPREYRLGFAYMLGNFWKIEDALPAADIVYRNKEVDYHLGWENWFARRAFAIRFGGNRDELDIGFGSVQDIGQSGLTLELNYAWLWPLEIEDTIGSHRISITIRFSGADRETPETPAVISPEITVMAQKAQELVKKGIIREEPRGLVVSLSSRVLFDFGQSVLKTRAMETLNELVELLTMYKDNNIIIEGHTDSIGTEVFNQRLSEARAQAVQTYFVNNSVAPERLSIAGFGETRPIDTNRTKEGRAQNRRVEIIILKTPAK